LESFFFVSKSIRSSTDISMGCYFSVLQITDLFFQLFKKIIASLIVSFSMTANMHSPSVDRQNSMTTEKNMKYDRQLRLWQEWGQKELENSKICLINASAVGTETLKNIILPGCGYFTIIDDNLITDDDLSNK
jgi:hypothetical protein